MKIRFYMDPEFGLPHIYKYEVREDEVEDVLRTTPVGDFCVGFQYNINNGSEVEL